jgi:hypothetical protein
MVMAEQAVLVTTSSRGVFFGYFDGEAEGGEGMLRLTRARQCVYWSPAMKGVLGLASTGPDADCKIGPAVPSLILMGVTAIVGLTPAAVAAWEAAPWVGEQVQQ